MRIEVVHHDHQFVRIGIVVLNQFSHEDRPIALGAPLSHLDDALAAQRFTRQKHTAKAVAFIFIILSSRMSHVHWLRFSQAVNQLFTAFVHTNEGLALLVGPLIHRQYFFHCHHIASIRVGNAPLPFQPRLEFVFFSVKRTVSSLTVHPDHRLRVPPETGIPPLQIPLALDRSPPNLSSNARSLRVLALAQFYKSLSLFDRTLLHLLADAPLRKGLQAPQSCQQRQYDDYQAFVHVFSTTAQSMILLLYIVLDQHRVRQSEARLKVGAAWQDHDYVFCTSIGTHLNPTRDVLDVLKSLLEKAGLPNIRFHDLRHSSATMLFGMKVHPKIVQELLGHSQISITMDIYSHVLPTMQEETMSKINEALQE